MGSFIILHFQPAAELCDNPRDAFCTIAMALASILASGQIPAGIFHRCSSAGID